MINRDERGYFLPGVSANPSGRRKLSDEEKSARANIHAAMIAMGTKSLTEIRAIAEDPNSPAIHAIHAKAIHWFVEKGNPVFYKEFLDRTLGKVAQQIDVNSMQLTSHDPAYRAKLLDFLKHSRTAQGIEIKDPIDVTPKNQNSEGS